MAGEATSCTCGARVEVPTLRELRQLAPVESQSRSRRSGAWTNRHRLAFVWLVVALGAAATIVLLAAKLPPLPQNEQPTIGPSVTESSSAEEVMTALGTLEKGLDPGVRPMPPEVKQVIDQRTHMLWGIRVLMVLGGCALVASIATVVSPRQKS